MAPEQFRNAHTVDVRSDIYSFGVVLFELVTSRLPFQAKTVANIERQHALHEAPSVIYAIPPRFTRIAQDVRRPHPPLPRQGPGRPVCDDPGPASLVVGDHPEAGSV